MIYQHDGFVIHVMWRGYPATPEHWPEGQLVDLWHAINEHDTYTTRYGARTFDHDPIACVKKHVEEYKTQIKET